MQAKKNHTTKPKKKLGINHPYVDGTAINAPDIIKDLMKLPPKLWMNVYVCHFKWKHAISSIRGFITPTTIASLGALEILTKKMQKEETVGCPIHGGGVSRQRKRGFSSLSPFLFFVFFSDFSRIILYTCSSFHAGYSSIHIELFWEGGLLIKWGPTTLARATQGFSYDKLCPLCLTSK